MPLLIIITGPSGVGKTTLCNRLLASDLQLARVVTCTNRALRRNELHGKHYYFLSTATFRQKINDGEFLEHAKVYGNLYGTLLEEVVRQLREGFDVLLSVDVQGAATVCQRARGILALRRAVVSLFLMPPSLAALEQRLHSRGQDAKSAIRQRLNAAEQEIDFAHKCDFIIPSNGIEETFELASAIITAERFRTTRVLVSSMPETPYPNII